jgi:hypothetical protein
LSPQYADEAIDVTGEAVARHRSLRGSPLWELNQKGSSMTEVTKIALAEPLRLPAVAEARARRRLISQWYKDAEGVLAIRWITAVELDEDHLPAALAA